MLRRRPSNESEKDSRQQQEKAWLNNESRGVKHERKRNREKQYQNNVKIQQTCPI